MSQTIRHMSYAQISEYMGRDATKAEGRAMWDILMERGYEEAHPVDVPEPEWQEILGEAVKRAALA